MSFEKSIENAPKIGSFDILDLATPPHRIKKIPPELRRQRRVIRKEMSFFRRLTLRLQHDSQFLRSVIQLSFLLLCIWIGFEFYAFLGSLSSPGQSPVQRPPGVEGFLPISALISLMYWFGSGTINDIHPSGLFIFVAIAATGFLLKKAFCSWLCPVGTISESLGDLGKKLFGRNITVTIWLDYPMRSIKYLLLLFFVWSIGHMDIDDLKAFVYSPYNKMADVKMFLFFANITSFALWTIIVLVILSVFIRNFWCRFLCPYGALLGALSWLSPLKITREKSTCIDCELCTKACPSNIAVHTAGRVWSDECTNCLACVQVCPVKDTLDVRTSFTATRVPTWVIGALVVGTFVGITGLAMLTGHWRNSMSQNEYLKRMKNIDSPLYQHNRGSVPKYDAQD
ncbi:MAG TPA: 4Fe-4S binding protein [Bacteroidota bacterium]|jgi:polyferredoxin|nr:4Fe-4S binding protein [Bacteroidota bacterium]